MKLRNRHTVALLFFVSSMANAIDSTNATSGSSSKDLDYCKVSFVDKNTGSSGTYGGQCLNNKPHGIGTVTFTNGDQLGGSFINGLLDGNGTYTSSNGNEYKGKWDQGKRNGFGVFTWARGSSYEGEWLDDKRHGQGTFKWTNGNRFEGEFRNNKRYNGKYYTSNGHVYKCRLGRCR